MNHNMRKYGALLATSRRSSTVKYALAPAAALAMALGATSAAATTYQVGPGQSYAKLQDVASRLKPGDVVEVSGGSTYGGGVVLDAAGSATSKITIRGIAANGKRPILSGGTNTIEFRADHYVFEGFEITGGSSRCVFHHADDITIRDTVVHDCPAQGILGADADSGSLTLSYVEVYACGNGDKEHQIYMATDETAHPGSVFRMEHCYVHDGNGGNNVKSRAERNEIYYNWLEGAYYRELELIGPDGQDVDVREDSDVVGNVLRKTKGSYIARFGGDGTGDTSGRYRFVNNTVLVPGGSTTIFQFFDSIESCEMHNNVFYSTGGGSLRIYDDSDASWVTGKAVIGGSNNWVQTGTSAIPSGWTGTLTGSDPGFANLAAWNLTPISSSPFVDHGNPSPTSPSGHEFVSPLAAPEYLPPVRALEAPDSARARPVVGVIDIGAYEFGTGGTSSTGSTTGGTSSTGSTTGSGSGTSSSTGSATSSTGSSAGGTSGNTSASTTSTTGATGGSGTTSTGGPTTGRTSGSTTGVTTGRTSSSGTTSGTTSTTGSGGSTGSSSTTTGGSGNASTTGASTSSTGNTTTGTATAGSASTSTAGGDTAGGDDSGVSSGGGCSITGRAPKGHRPQALGWLSLGLLISAPYARRRRRRAK